MAQMNNPLWTSSDWSFDLIYKIWNEIDKISNEMSLSYHTPQIELINSEQMLDVYTSIGIFSKNFGNLLLNANLFQKMHEF